VNVLAANASPRVALQHYRAGGGVHHARELPLRPLAELASGYGQPVPASRSIASVLRA